MLIHKLLRVNNDSNKTLVIRWINYLYWTIQRLDFELTELETSTENTLNYCLETKKTQQANIYKVVSLGKNSQHDWRSINTK